MGGMGKKLAQARRMADIADASRQRVNEAAGGLVAEVRRQRRLVTVNRLLCLVVLAGWTWQLVIGH